jgi:hypothetical protein
VRVALRGRPSYDVYAKHVVYSTHHISAGSSSLILTMNGASSKGVVLTVGRYGSVMTGARLPTSRTDFSPLLDLLPYAYRYPHIRYP